MAGDSTGGMLLISVLYRLLHQGTPLPRCAVLLCPGADCFAAEAVNPDDPAMVAEHRRFQAAYLNGHPLDDPAANPLRADLTGFPPMLIQAAAGDQFTRGAHELAERARRYGVPTTEELYPVSAHDFQSFWSFLPEAADALRHASRFIRGSGDAMNGDDSNEHERRSMNDTATRVHGRRYGKVFDEIAAEDDRRRPAYPDELIDQACQVAGIGSGDHVLEVGCGSGQLTRGLVARGLHVTALEPGKSLIALARKNLEGAGEVEFVNAQFEDAVLPRERFQAVFSASAFHWIDPKVSWQKAAAVLVPGGTLALVQYCGLEEPRSKRDQEAALAAIRKVAPDVAAEWRPTGISTPRSPGWSNAEATSQRYGPGSAATT